MCIKSVHSVWRLGSDDVLCAQSSNLKARHWWWWRSSLSFVLDGEGVGGGPVMCLKYTEISVCEFKSKNMNVIVWEEKADNLAIGSLEGFTHVKWGTEWPSTPGREADLIEIAQKVP